MRKILFCFFLLILIGCQPLLRSMYGIKTLHKVDPVEINEVYDQVDWSAIQTIKYIADSNEYKALAKLVEGQHRKKDLSQPVQLLYFEHDSLKSFHANCYAQGNMSGLIWNTDARFDQFIPKSAVAADSFHLTLSQYLKTFKRLNIADTNLKKNTVVLLWTNMLHKISKSAMDCCVQNIRKFAKESESAIVLINLDESFLESN